MPYHVYILECSDGSFYTGITSDLEKRLMQHQSGYYRESYTHNRRPVELKWYCSFTNVDQAIETEKRIKKWSAAKKQALINDDWTSIENLAKKRFKK